MKYDLIGMLAEQTDHPPNRSRYAQGISKATFDQYPTNPEDFIHKAAQLINEKDLEKIWGQ